jgi:hypothetical protein
MLLQYRLIAPHLMAHHGLRRRLNLHCHPLMMYLYNQHLYLHLQKYFQIP